MRGNTRPFLLAAGSVLGLLVLIAPPPSIANEPGVEEPTISRGTCCPGDVDGSGQVGESDVTPLVNVLLTGSGTPEQLCAADVNNDGIRNGHDVRAFVSLVLPAGPCTAGRCDNDGICENGCELNLNTNPFCAPFFLGSINGDSGSMVINRFDVGEHWYSARLLENNSGSVYLSGRITLQPGPTGDYDLYVYCVACGSLIGSSTGGVGQVEQFFVRNDDDFFASDDFTFIVEVRWRSGGCDGFLLTVNGNVVAPTNNCDP